VEGLRNLHGATHAYSFWEGVPGDARAAFGRLFAQSKDTMGVAVVQRSMRGCDPVALMHTEYDFPNDLVLEESFPVLMSGSGQMFTAYIFSRLGRQPPKDAHQVTDCVPIPTPPTSPERAVAMLTDEEDGAEGLRSPRGGRSSRRKKIQATLKTPGSAKPTQKLRTKRSRELKSLSAADEMLDSLNGVGKTAFPLTRRALRQLSSA
jgi:hypothetical protein